MTDKSGNVLNFEMAMAHFQSMFPDLNAQMIEMVLRKYDGNVAQTIEELLERSAAICSTSPSTSNSFGGGRCAAVHFEGDKEGKDDDPKKKQTAKMPTNAKGGGGGIIKNNGHSTAPQQQKQQQRDPCADDEKIALLIQNREFLRYLRHDPHFQRAMIGQHQASASGRHAHRYPLPPGPTLGRPPLLLASTRPSRSPNTGRFFHRPSSRKSPRDQLPEEWPESVPDGPVVETAEQMKRELAIPEGPLIDYVDADGRETGWAGRIKAKLSRKEPEGSVPMPASPVVHYSDEQMVKGIQGMLAKGGKGLLEGLARKFSTRKQRANNRMRMEEEEEEAEDEEEEHGPQNGRRVEEEGRR